MTDLEQSLREAMDSGDADAAEKLLPLVYDELKRIAALRLRHEAPHHTLQATDLLHEAYLRLFGPGGQEGRGWDGRGNFHAVAAEAMRRILVERARARGAQKRGGGRDRDPLPLSSLFVDDVPVEVLDLDAALDRLAEKHPEKAELVKLRFFGGLTLYEAGAVQGISPSTADRHWAFARAWLFAAIEGRI